jgi:NAD(P)-dependent dehydrogenase (short-subunit alcohol dehydrogenase family)
MTSGHRVATAPSAPGAISRSGAAFAGQEANGDVVAVGTRYGNGALGHRAVSSGSEPLSDISLPGLEPASVMITGAGRGFGAALVNAYAALPSQVVALVRSEKARQDLKERHGNRVDVIIGDVAKASHEQKIRSQLNTLDRPIDLLVNNAGAPGTSNDLANVDVSEVERLFQTHCLGALRVTRAALPFLNRRDGARIVNISSRISSMGRNAEGHYARRRYSYAYRIAKAAQNMLSLCLLEELGPEGIDVFAIHPGQLTTASVSPDAALSPERAAEMFLAFMKDCKPGQRGPALLRDTVGRVIPW